MKSLILYKQIFNKGKIILFYIDFQYVKSTERSLQALLESIIPWLNGFQQFEDGPLNQKRP